MAAKKKPARKGNPASSPWYATPDAARNRKRVQFSLSPETIARIAELAEALGLSQSAVVEQAVLALGEGTAK